MAGAGSGCPGEEGAGPLREAQSGCFATSGAAARPPRASPGVGTVSQISGTRGSGRAGVLIVELMAGSQGSWDRSKSPAWGWEAGMWGTNLPLWVRFPQCNGSCITPLSSPPPLLTQRSQGALPPLCLPASSGAPGEFSG